MASIFPIPTVRSSEVLLQSRTLLQLRNDQTELLRLQEQISTGFRINRGSDDPQAATRATTLQRILEQKEQVKTNLTTGKSFLHASDVALSDVSSLLISIRGTALTVVDSTTTESQRAAASQEILQGIQRLTAIANQKFRERFLFAGSTPTTQPFDPVDEFVSFRGNENSLQSFADLGFLFDTNINGNEVFGALSADVAGSADLDPVLTPTTRLSELRGGKGITPGSILISDGSSTSTIDLSSAETIGDIAQRIEANPPEGRQLTVTVGASGLNVDIDDTGGGNLTIRNVQGGTTAAELGILESVGTGTAPIVGKDLNPRLRLTTRLNETFGGAGFDLTGLQIINGGGTHTVSFAGAETIEDVLNILNSSNAGVLAEINKQGNGIHVRSRISGSDFHIGENGGTTATQLGIRTLALDTPLEEVNFGRGVDAQSGTDFVIHRKDGFDLEIDISSAQTIGDVIDLINNDVNNQDPLTRVTAQLATVGNGIQLIDNNAAGPDALSVVKEPLSRAAIDLGFVAEGNTQTTAAAGNPQVLTARDTNAKEVHGVFNTLIRFNEAIENFDLAEIERTVAMLDEDISRVNFARAEVGVRVQSLEALQDRLAQEDVELRSTLSDEIDVDLAEAISDFTGRQAAFEASLRLVAQSFQLSLLNFL